MSNLWYVKEYPIAIKTIRVSSNDYVKYKKINRYKTPIKILKRYVISRKQEKFLYLLNAKAIRLGLFSSYQQKVPKRNQDKYDRER
jgi:hypothetical protein